MQHLTKPASPPVENFLKGNNIEPEKVLLEAWRPLVFTTRTASDQMIIAYLADEAEVGDWYFLAPITELRLSELQNGELPLRDAITCSWMWQCLHEPGGVIIWNVDLNDIPNVFLPLPGTPLLHEQDAMLVAGR
jgi:hypothetical protein